MKHASGSPPCATVNPRNEVRLLLASSLAGKPKSTDDDTQAATGGQLGARCQCAGLT